MTLSDALREIKFEIKRADGRASYRPISAVLCDHFGISPEELIERFPLGFGSPVFVINGQTAGKFWRFKIPEEAQPSAHFTGVLFICDVIDCLFVKCGWDEATVAGWVAEIEAGIVDG